MDLVQVGYTHTLDGYLEKLGPAARGVFTYLMLQVHPFASIWKKIAITSRKLQESQKISRNQVNYALKTLRNQGLIQTESSQGREGMTVTINWSKLGLDPKSLQSSTKTLQSLQSDLLTGPVDPPPAFKTNNHNHTIHQVAKSVAAAPLKDASVSPQNTFGSTSTSSTTVQATPKVAPPAMASGEFLPTPKPTFRAMLSQERLKELCVKPPASFAALFDEVEPDWRVNTKPHYMRQIEAVDEAFRPSQLSEWALWQILKFYPDNPSRSTQRPASYLPKLFQWDDPKGPYPGKNTLKNVADDDPTGAKKARRDVEKMQRSLATDKDEPTPEQRVNIQKQLREASLAVSGG